MTKRSYNEAFLKLGFTKLNGKSKCVVCLKVLFAESIKKNKKKRHLETNHLTCLNKPVEFFERKLNSIPGQRNVIIKFTVENTCKLRSCLLFVRCFLPNSKPKKAHRIGEDLLKSVMNEVVKTIYQ